jgi:hypothetical protein
MRGAPPNLGRDHIVDEVYAAIEPFGFRRDGDQFPDRMVVFSRAATPDPPLNRLEGADANILVALAFQDGTVTINDRDYGHQTDYSARLEAALAKVLSERLGIRDPVFKRVMDWPLGA